MSEKLPSSSTIDEPTPEPHTQSVGDQSTAAQARPRPARRSPEDRAFADGELISGRYRVRRLIGQGGMGEVYEVEDRDLHMSVALKTIRRDLADSDVAVERFKREILLARKVTHPGVGRIFDLGQHTPPGRAAPLHFLTMELLDGETLAQRVARGPLPLHEVRLLVTEMAAALDAAHAAGVVHRDFKTANVLLLPLAKDASSVRPVVMDFGIARVFNSTADDAGDARITGAGGLVGTPAYMAPEQIEAGPISPATDVYALAVVTYEMLTGQLPFVGGSALAVAAKRFSQPTPSPRASRPDLPASWDRAVMRAMSRDPSARFSSAGAFARALNESRRSSRWPWALVGLGGLALASTAVWYGVKTRAHHPAPSPSVSTTAARRSLAVLSFKNLSGRADSEWLATALPEMLSMELAASDELRTLPTERVAEAERAAHQGSTPVGRLLDADYLVEGAYLDMGGARSVRLDVKLYDAHTGDAVGVFTVEGSEEGLLSLVASSGGRLRTLLGVAAPSVAAEGMLRASLPANSDAARLYAEGLERLHRFDVRAARDLLTQAVERDPGNALMRSELAKADSQLGFDSEARAESERAVQASQSLSREERLMVEANHYELTSQWQKAMGVYQALGELYPDNIDYTVRRGWVEARGSDARAALKTVALLRRLPHSADVDVHIDLIEAGAEEKLSDWKAELAAAARAAAQATAAGANVERARALRHQAWAYLQLGDLPHALEAAQSCQKQFAAAHNPWGEAQGYNMIGNVERARQHHQAAEAAWQQSLQLSDAAGDRDGQATALNNLATFYVDTNQLERAAPLYDRVLALSRALGDDAGLAYTWGDVATLYTRLSKYDEAVHALNQSIELFQKMGNGVEAAVGQSDLAALRRDLGESAAARTLLDEALAGFVGAKEETLATQTRVELAHYDLDEKSHTVDEPMLRVAVTQLAAAKNPAGEARAHEALARVALARHQNKIALDECAQAQKLTRDLEDAKPRLDAGLVAAAVDIASGDRQRAAQVLDAVQSEAQTLHHLPRYLEAEVLRARLESGAAARKRLANVARQARAHGLERIASEATHS